VERSRLPQPQRPT